MSFMQRTLVWLVDGSRRHAWMVVLAGILLAAGSGFYASHHLGVNTDTDQMFSASLPWRQRAWQWTAPSRSSRACWSR